MDLKLNSKTLNNPQLLGVRSRLTKLQETLHYFLVQPNLSWNDALEKYNLLATQAYNLTQELPSQELKTFSVYPVQTLPDPNLIPNVYLRTRFSSEEIEKDRDALAEKLQIELFPESPNNRLISSLTDEQVEEHLKKVRESLIDYDKRCFALIKSWESLTAMEEDDDMDMDKADLVDKDVDLEEYLESFGQRLEDGDAGSGPMVQGSLDRMLQFMNVGFEE